MDRFGRLRRIVELYGPLDYSPLPDIVLARLTGFCDWIRQRRAAGDPAVEVHLREDHIGIYEADMAWITSNRASLEAALGG